MRRRNNLFKDVGGFTAAGVSLGVGAGIAAKAQAGSGISVTPAFATAAGMMRPVGVAMMGKHAIRGIQNLQPKKKRHKRR